LGALEVSVARSCSCEAWEPAAPLWAEATAAVMKNSTARMGNGGRGDGAVIRWDDEAKGEIRRAKSEIRSAEIRRKSEIRNPKSASGPSFGAVAA